MSGPSPAENRVAGEFREIHRDPTGQVAWYQTEGRYYDLLTQRFGERFLDYRRRWRETSERGAPGDFPLSLDLAINSGCQLQCLMCPLPGRAEGRTVRLMSADLFERLMDQAAECRLPALTLGLGSEPLLNPRAAEWVCRAGRAGIMDIRLGTNGLLLTPPTIDALVDGPLTRLEISVDAVRPETYRTIRGGRLETLERLIELFLETRLKAGREMPLLRLSFLRLEANRDELDGFLRRWHGRTDLISIQEPIWFPGSHLPRPPAPGRPLAPLCGQPWQRLAVEHDGRVWPCCSWYGDRLLSFNAGDLPLADIWRSPEMAALRRRLQGPPDDLPPDCRRCEY